MSEAIFSESGNHPKPILTLRSIIPLLHFKKSKTKTKSVIGNIGIYICVIYLAKGMIQTRWNMEHTLHCIFGIQ